MFTLSTEKSARLGDNRVTLQYVPGQRLRSTETEYANTILGLAGDTQWKQGSNRDQSMNQLINLSDQFLSVFLSVLSLLYSMEVLTCEMLCEGYIEHEIPTLRSWCPTDNWITLYCILEWNLIGCQWVITMQLTKLAKLVRNYGFGKQTPEQEHCMIFSSPVYKSNELQIAYSLLVIWAKLCMKDHKHCIESDACLEIFCVDHHQSIPCQL